MSTWRKVAIKELAIGVYDGPHATPPPSETGPVYLGIDNVTAEGRLDLSEVRHIAEEDFDAWTKRAVPQAGDVVFSYEATLHRYALIPPGFAGCLGRRMALVRPDPSKTDSRFLHYAFLAPAWRMLMESNTLHGSTVNRIPLGRFPEFELLVPEPGIQHRLASILGAYDELIENNAKRIRVLEEMARTRFLMTEASVRFELHSKTLAEMCGGASGVQTGPFGSQLHEADYSDAGVTVVMPKDIVNGRIREAGAARIPESKAQELSRHLLAVGDIVYGRRGDLGRRALISKRTDGAFCGTGCLKISLQRELANPRYIYWLLGMSDVISLIASRAVGSTMPNLNAKILGGVELRVPPLGVQQKFDDEVGPIDDLIEVLERRNRALRESRDLLLPRLMSGELSVDRIPDPQESLP